MFAPRLLAVAAACCTALQIVACNNSSPEANDADSESSNTAAPLDASSSAKADQITGPSPHTDLTPEQVVRLQLEAFRNSASDKSAYDVALRFFVPEVTVPGRREALSERLQQVDFAALFDFTSAEYGTVEITGDQARQIVLLQNEADRIEFYLFVLRRRANDPYGGCWLTEAIVPDQLDLSVPLAESAG